VRSWLATMQMQRRARGNCSSEWLWLAAAHDGARVTSEGLDPHSHLHPLFVGGGGVGLTGPVFRRYGPTRIRGRLDGLFHPHPLSRRNNTGYQRFEGPTRHALTRMRMQIDHPLARFEFPSSEHFGIKKKVTETYVNSECFTE
jgi:hypothetical protein